MPIDVDEFSIDSYQDSLFIDPGTFPHITLVVG